MTTPRPVEEAVITLHDDGETVWQWICSDECTLTDDERQALVRVFMGFRPEDTWRALGISRETLRLRTRRGIAKVRAGLGVGVGEIDLRAMWKNQHDR
jgi:DNA-directed RNA polymerase specialized sigma24 family protein